MIKISLLICCFCCLSYINSVSAQGKEANYWYFGNKCGITFRDGSPPTALLDGESVSPSQTGTASISDKDGNLLFYTTGRKVWNKNHEIMDGGDNIGTYSVQGAMIVQDPANEQRYYIFNFATPDGFLILQDSIVDMSNGLGQVLPNHREIFLYSNTSTHLSAVRHANMTDVWVVTHALGTNRFAAFQVTADSVKTSPVESYAGSTYIHSTGYMKFSSDATWVGIANVADNLIELLHFDNSTGIVSNENVVTINTTQAYGVEFSPDNTKFYSNGGFYRLFQYDLTSGDPQQIAASAVQLAEDLFGWGALQLGPDGKIYVGTGGSGGYLGVIHEPDKPGTACNFEFNAIYLLGKDYMEGLPSFMQSYMRNPEFTTSQYCSGTPTQFNIVNINGIDSVFWKFHDTGNAPNDTSTLFSPLYTFSTAGTFYVELTAHSGLLHRTVIDTVIIFETPSPELGSDTTFCPNDPINLTLDAGPGTTYNWNGNFNPGGSTFVVTDVGTYWVRVSANGCVGRDTISISRYEEATIDITNLDITSPNCGSNDGAITGIQFSAPDPFTVTWLDIYGNQVGTGNDLLNVPAGSYTAEVHYGNNCTQTFGPYSIADNNAPVIASALPEDDDHCYQGMGSIIVTPETGHVTDYQYSFNGTDFFPLTAEISGLIAGPYSITLKDQFGCISAPVSVEVPNVEGPTINCIPTPESGSTGDGTITVISPNINLTYQLEGGLPQSGNVFTGLSADTYYVMVTDEFGCITRDTVLVENHTGSLLVALADHDRKCLYKPASSDIRIARVTDMKDLKATLYFNDNILNCTHFNANTSYFPDITAQLFTTPPRVEIEWHGATPVTNADTLLLGSMIFETLQQGVADITWEANSTITYFLNVSGDSIKPSFFPGEIVVHEIPEISINQPPAVCEQGSITLIPQITGGTVPMEYAWLTPNGTSQSQQLEVQNAESADAGNYQFTVSDNFYCADTVQVNLTVIPLPTANFPTINDTIHYEQTFLLEATPGYFSYEWNTGDTTYFITGTEEGNYSVIIKTAEGCTTIDSAYLKDVYMPFYFNVPNAFTPDGDGLNDVFRPIATTDLIRQFSLVIYNRWGQLIFETANPAEGWNGKNAPAGVYSWVISYSDMVGKVSKLRGGVMLVK